MRRKSIFNKKRKIVYPGGPGMRLHSMEEVRAGSLAEDTPRKTLGRRHETRDRSETTHHSPLATHSAMRHRAGDLSYGRGARSVLLQRGITMMEQRGSERCRPITKGSNRAIGTEEGGAKRCFGDEGPVANGFGCTVGAGRAMELRQSQIAQFDNPDRCQWRT
jgi:hypothetical protein